MRSIVEVAHEPANALIGKMINVVGLASVTVGGSEVAEKAGIIKQGLASQDWVAIISAIGGVVFIAKNLLDMYINWKGHKNKMSREDNREEP